MRRASLSSLDRRSLALFALTLGVFLVTLNVTVVVVACALAPSGGSLIAFRVLMAVGGTALTPTSLSIVANLYPEARERARAIGLWGISSGVGTGLGPIVGGSLTDAFGWRSVFA